MTIGREREEDVGKGRKKEIDDRERKRERKGDDRRRVE